VARSIRVTLELDTKPFIDGLKKAEQASNSFNSTVSAANNKSNQSFNLLNTNLSKFTKLLGIGALVSFAKGAIDLADNLGDVADATGFSAEGVFALQRALMTSGGSAEDVISMLTKFSQTVDDVTQLNEKAVSSFQRIGISLDDIAGATPEELFLKVAKALALMPEGAQKTALALEIVGKNAKGVSFNQEFVKRLEDSQKKSEEFAESIKRTQQFTDSLKLTFMDLQITVLRIIQPLLDGFLLAKEGIEILDKELIKLSEGFVNFGKVVEVVISGILLTTGIGGLLKGIGLLQKALGVAKIGLGGLVGIDAFKSSTESADKFSKGAKKGNEIVLESNKELLKTLDNITLSYQSTFEKQKQNIKNQIEMVGLSDKEKVIQEELNKLREQERDKLLELTKLRTQFPSSAGEIDKRMSDVRAEYENQRQEVQKTLEARQAAEEDFGLAMSESFKNYRDEATNAARIARDVFSTATKGMEDALTKFVKTGKLSFKSLISDMLETILRSQIQAIVAQIFSIGGKVGGGILGNIGNVLGFANGGMIPNNGPMLVGERGPEIISGAAGRIVTPNNQLGGGTVTYYINAVDAMSFKQMIAQDPQFIYALTEQGRRSVPGTRR
jgi:lambda family phage tail tape measure protein